MATASLPPGFGGGLLGLPSHHGLQIREKHARVKKVSWASGDRLCQVRLFAAEDAPALSGTARQELLQEKQTKFMHAITRVSATDIPPGFGPTVPKSMGPAVAVAAIVPQLAWRVPEVFNLDTTWLVAAGGASHEVKLQKQREVRVLEAVYPRPSAIPESPAEPQEPELAYDDDKTLLIPLADESSMAGRHGTPQDSARPGSGAPSPPQGFGSSLSKLSKPAVSSWYKEVTKDGGPVTSSGDSNGSLNQPQRLPCPLCLPVKVSLL